MLTTKRVLAMAIALLLLLGTFACSSSVNYDADSSADSYDVSDEESVISEITSSFEESYDSELTEDSSVAQSSESTDISLDNSDESSEENSVASSESSEESVTSEPSESNTESTEESSSSAEESDDSDDEKLAASFVKYADPVNYSLSWQSAGLELYNTDFRLSEELENKLKRRLSSFSNAQSVMLIELDTNMAFAYSKDKKIATASAIKGPMALYVNKCVDAGIITWDSMIAYQKRHFQAHSTGVVQNYEYGSKFRASRLIDFMISISDNQAYLMLKDMVGGSNFNRMMATLGCTQIIPDGANWGYITAAEMAATWREIYYYNLKTASGAKLFDRFLDAEYNYIKRAIPQYVSAHKSGWSSKAFNDAGVVFAGNHEYVLVVLCGRSSIEDSSSQAHFTAVTKLLAELMEEYNTYLDGDTSVDNSEDVSTDSAEDVSTEDVSSESAVSEDNSTDEVSAVAPESAETESDTDISEESSQSSEADV